ncbi:MAG: Crp/Fnr family transcriptional regulator [Pyrinomonadaceae bacterium]
MNKLAEQIPVLNRLLSSLPQTEYEHLLPNLEQVHLPKGKILYHAGDMVGHGYFINNGMISLLSMTEDGSTVEVAMVGNEGAVGLPVILRNNKTPYQIMVQIPVQSALRIKSGALRNEFDRGGKFQDLMLRYTHVLFTQISQSAVCNRFHNAEKRLGRWLLITNDLVKEDTFLLTHEIIGHMLGTPRTGVTMAAGALQREGLIRYARGKITILDRPGLESVACECYQVIKEGFDHFLEEEE